MTPGAAITAMAAISAFGPDQTAFADGLRRGRTAIVDQGGQPGPRYRARLAWQDLPTTLDAITALPDDLRRAASRIARRTPRTVQAGLAVAVQAWVSAGLHERPTAPDRIGVVVTAGDLDGQYAQHVHALHTANPARVPPTFALHTVSTSQIGVISHTLGITGPGFTVGLASAAGNAAVIAAARLIATDEVDVCLVVGALAEPSLLELTALANLGALAWEGRSVPFDTARCGFVVGEATGCLVLESTRNAQRREAPILAVLAGYGHLLDANSLPNPAVPGEVAAMRAALRRAGLRPAQIDYVNTHGTGSLVGDHTEVEALRQVFGDVPGQRPWLNSTKSLTGHCIGAAGVIEAIATVEQMAQGYVHANAGLTDPLPTAGRFTGPAPEPASIRAALSNGFAFGGVNTCLAFVTHP
ncbi:polyketide beta-ketoacyl:ACP synthase [Micromonospora sp. RHAY321]|uniref:beta-ketoacyl synthase N-terminal-like domain-containing protein n=1 Tax=Micromonospora sp. RHAY321 TaxID=2944807 RepID=UPI00207D45A8|nr:beta-ketoacyl synthase N-terminal-like domain-containing protein [Micromonospora sp. RHAY321]MCO1593980.1 polyketide beta-ketoacyl:ACP synthase [Micromonospora sp. RHAY321]